MPAWRTSATCAWLGDRCRERGHLRRRRPVADEDVVAGEDVERGQRRRAGQRIAGVAMRMQEGAVARVVEEAIVEFLRRQHRRQRQEPAGQALRQAQQVGHDAGLLAGEQRAGAAEADRDLVGDQEHAMGVAQLAHALEIHRIVHAHPAGALHARLEDQRADLAGMLVEQARQRIGGILGVTGRALARARVPGIGRRREQRLGQQRRVHAPIQRDVADGERADGFAVIAVLQRHELAAPRFAAIVEPVEGHLQRDFDAGRAVVGIEHLGQRRAACLARRQRQQAFGEFDRRRVRAAGEDHVFQRARLPRDGFGDARLGVAEQVGPPAADRIEVAATVTADQPGTFAACDRQQRQRVRMLAHLRARMPQHGKVARTPALGVGYHRQVMQTAFHPDIIAPRRTRRELARRQQARQWPTARGLAGCAP